MRAESKGRGLYGAFSVIRNRKSPDTLTRSLVEMKEVMHVLNRFDRNRQQILDQADFLLQKRLGINHAAQHPVITRHCVHTFVNFIVSREQVLARFLIAELRFVGHNGSKLSFKLVTDIHYKRWPDVVIQGCVNNLERPMRRQRLSLTRAEIGLADS